MATTPPPAPSEFLPKPSYTARNYATIKKDIEDFIKRTRPDVWSDFLEANIGQMFVEMMAYTGDMLSFGQDSTALEIFLATCKRYDSALRFARSVGYKVRSAKSATVAVKSLQFPAALVENGGVISKGSYITGFNNIRFELLEDAAIEAGDTVSRIVLREGISYVESFNFIPKPSPEYTVSNAVVEDASWEVFVGDPDDPANEWTEVDNVQFENTATHTFDTFYDGEGRLHVRFGDGSAGAIPNANLTIKYRTTSGYKGNAPVGSVNGAFVVELNNSAGSVSLQYLNKDIDSEVRSGTELRLNESQGATLENLSQSGTLSKFPIIPGTVTLVFNLLNGGGQIVLKDDEEGEFSILSNTTETQIDGSSLTYSEGTWAVTFDTLIEAGGTVTATYYYVTAPNPLEVAILGSAIGGEDRETLTELKNNIPAFIRSSDKVLSLEDYNSVVRRIDGIAKVFTDYWVSSYSANIVKVHLWTSEIVDFVVSSNDALLNTTVLYRRFKQLPHNRVADVIAFLKPRSLMTVHNTIYRPPMLWIDLYLGDVTYDKRYNRTVIHAAIVNAIVSLFQDGDGFVLRLSDLYDKVREVNGVKNFIVQRIATGNQAYSTELQGYTTTSQEIGGTLLEGIVTPGTVEISIEQTDTLTIKLKDDGEGGFVVSGGTYSVEEGAIDYQTGEWSATVSDPLIPNQRILASYSDVKGDFRQDHSVELDDPENPDLWPPSGVSLIVPTSPPYSDGRPLSPALPHDFVSGDSLTYDKLGDIIVKATPSANNIYDETFEFNNEIYYDSVEDLQTNLRVINLRRLVFDLVPSR